MTELRDLCYNLQQCTEKLEEEIKININDIHNSVCGNTYTETSIALEKAKDYHYKEITNFLNDILRNIKLILFHEEKIRFLSHKNNLTRDEILQYSYTQKQNDISNNEKTHLSLKREKRRVASEISVESLENWEKYLDQKKEHEESVKTVKPVKKRNKDTVRKKKKFISSTANGFLENSEKVHSLESIHEDFPDVKEENTNVENTEESEDDLPEKIGTCLKDHVNIEETTQKINVEPCNHDDTTKPRIVELLYKKKPTYSPP